MTCLVVSDNHLHALHTLFPYTTLFRSDAITLADLQATGATKWSRGSDLIGAFVAEMDFGIAAPITRRLHREVDRAAFGYLPRDLKAEMREATTAFLRERTGWEDRKSVV